MKVLTLQIPERSIPTPKYQRIQHALWENECSYPFHWVLQNIHLDLRGNYTNETTTAEGSSATLWNDETFC